jgi:hypothetical protein
MERIRGGASDLTDLVRSGAQAAKEQAVETAEQLGEVVRDEAGRVINAKRGKAASKIRKAGMAADAAARLLRAGRIEGLARYVDLAAETAEHASDYVKDRDFQSILEDLEGLAKRHPVAVFGGVLATAFAAGRLLKVLQEGEIDDQDDDDQDEDEDEDEDEDQEDVEEEEGDDESDEAEDDYDAEEEEEVDEEDEKADEDDDDDGGEDD